MIALLGTLANYAALGFAALLTIRGPDACRLRPASTGVQSKVRITLPRALRSIMTA